MTQELINWVLLAGLVGISWLMVITITGDDRRTDKGVHTHETKELSKNGTPSHRGMAV
ncbi:MAG: hypothetical protein Q8N04_09520 [Nitrospira sp.]|nr:hypothetical protein [Nitrospira sp.]